MSKITLDNLSDNLKQYLNGLGLTESQVQQLINRLKEEEIGDINNLQTNNKTLVSAINELFQNANNGKELIADAIGEPLDSSDTFQAMSNDIHGLLSTFKTNMMKNGVTVSGTDKFKSLIDKIATMIEDGEGKGIQYASGDATIIAFPSSDHKGLKIELPLYLIWWLWNIMLSCDMVLIQYMQDN